MKTKVCNFCGSDRYEERQTEYIYSHDGKYLLVPNTPIEVCLNCGMVYYDGPVLEKIEKRFFAIHREHEKPDSYIKMPTVAFA